MAATCLVFGHPLHEDWNDDVQPVCSLWHFAVVHGSLLQAVQLVQATVDRHVSHKMEHVIILFRIQINQVLKTTNREL